MFQENKYLNNHEDYMNQAINLAKKGSGRVSPNPLVGCVIVKGGRVIGEGFHEFFGGDHAEVSALKNCIESPNGASLYVNLEPCSVYGKTPPCVKSIIESSISEVYIGTRDYNPDVNGSGMIDLEKAGIKVEYGILEKECYDLNKFFFKWIKNKIPYVISKVAQSKNGFMGINNTSSTWITGEKSRIHCHNLRSMTDAILIGKNTALIDNPSLTVREVLGHNPKRIILDTNRALPLNLKVFNDNEAETIVMCLDKNFSNTSTSYCKYIPTKSKDNILCPNDILKKLGRLGITSILIEGGKMVHQSFNESNLIDELYIYTSNENLNDAELDNPLTIDESWDIQDQISLDDDILKIAKKKNLCLQE